MWTYEDLLQYGRDAILHFIDEGERGLTNLKEIHNIALYDLNHYMFTTKSGHNWILGYLPYSVAVRLTPFFEKQGYIYCIQEEVTDRILFGNVIITGGLIPLELLRHVGHLFYEMDPIVAVYVEGTELYDILTNILANI